MLKTISVSALALAVVGFAAPAMAQMPPPPTNPWTTQVTVPITVTVAKMVELQANQTAVSLSVNDAGGNGGSANATDSWVRHLSNVPVDIFASIDDHIPTNTEFWIVVESDGSWTYPNVANDDVSTATDGTHAEGFASWMRAGNGTYTAGAVGTAQFAFDRPSTAGTQLVDNQVDIEYFATGWNYMPAQQTETFNVVWTIAEDNTP